MNLFLALVLTLISTANSQCTTTNIGGLDDDAITSCSAGCKVSGTTAWDDDCGCFSKETCESCGSGQYSSGGTSTSCTDLNLQLDLVYILKPLTWDYVVSISPKNNLRTVL